MMRNYINLYIDVWLPNLLARHLFYIGESKRTGYPGKDVTAPWGYPGPGVTQGKTSFCLQLLFVGKNKKHTYSWCKVSCHIHAQEFILVQELINYGYLFIFIIRKTVLRYWWIDKKPNQQLEDKRVPLWEASNSPLSPAPRGDSETLDRIHTTRVWDGHLYNRPKNKRQAY